MEVKRQVAIPFRVDRSGMALPDLFAGMAETGRNDTSLDSARMSR